MHATGSIERAGQSPPSGRIDSAHTAAQTGLVALAMFRNARPKKLPAVRFCCLCVPTMKIDCEQLPGDVYKLVLAGRMDLPGTEAIETEFAKMAGPPQNRIVVDLSGVNFVTSYGIRMLLFNAKGVYRRGGRMVLLNPDPNVTKILEVAGIESLIPIRSNLSAALEQLDDPAGPLDEDN